MRSKPRVINTERLPLRRLSNGVWQLRKRVLGDRRIEVSLGTTNRAIAEQRARDILSQETRAVVAASWAEQVEAGAMPGGWLRNAQARIKYRSGAIVPLALLVDVAHRSGGACEVSGIAFYIGHEKRHPFQPSFDRIDSDISYEAANIRLVCLAVNQCMGPWGEKIFRTIAAATMAKQLAQMAESRSAWVKGGEKFTPNSHIAAQESSISH